MQINLSLILLIVAVSLLLLLIIFSIRARYSKRHRQVPGGHPIQDLALDNEMDVLEQPITLQQPHYNAPVEPIVSDSLSMNAMDAKIEPKLGMKMHADSVTASPPPPTSTKPKQANALVLYAMAKEQPFTGYELLQTLLAAGLCYGKMSIFHRHEQPSGEGKILFSAAQATEPGIFDMNAMGATQCNGLILFMQVTGPEHNKNSLQLMIETAEQLAEELEGVLLNDKRQPWAAEDLESYQTRL